MWLAQYAEQRPDPVRLQAQIDRFMQAFDERMDRVTRYTCPRRQLTTRQEKQAADAAPVIDEDGFTLVVGKKKKPRLYKEEGDGAVQPEAKKKKKQKLAPNFYRFQRVSKKQEGERLRDALSLRMVSCVGRVGDAAKELRSRQKEDRPAEAAAEVQTPMI